MIKISLRWRLSRLITVSFVMKILIVYSTVEGHTRRIAEFLATETCLVHHNPIVISTSRQMKIDVSDFDAVVVAASIYAGQYSNEIVDYITMHASRLNETPAIFLSVGLSIINKDTGVRRSLEETTKHFLHVTGWNPLMVEQVAGALLYSRYGFIKKMLMRSIMKKAGAGIDTSRDYVYTNWDSLRHSMEKFITKAEPVHQ